MKKILLSLGAAVLLAAGAQAQTSWGLKAGVNLGKYSNAPDGAKDYQKMNTSFYVTGYADLPVAPNFSVQPGLSLQGKGDKYSFDGDNLDGSSTTNVMALEVPVNAVYYIPTGYSGSVFLGAGPYVGYSLSGKQKIKGNIGGTQAEGEYDIDFSGDDKHQKPFDFGLNFMAGYKLSNGFLVNAGYGLGLTNLSPSSNSDNKFSNRVLSFGVGYQF
ncbi:porin family protein [Sphingobacterium chuzhouense]|uniref:PorT family protein n=1 Tax=Sphingobacterium chuzhouense TaxID=1742264 RepID=A0ABR7XSJ2_9SPHI|nr:porin family protein [Sphingobacterium chuzhouense]MBD1422144.1 PorT family protein [Sphingobacterium chuzhouense]